MRAYAYAPIQSGSNVNQGVGGMFLRVTLTAAAAIATATVGWASPANAQSPIAEAITGPTSPVFSADDPADDECGGAWEWSKTVGRCIPVPTAAPTAPAGQPFFVLMGTVRLGTQVGACKAQPRDSSDCYQCKSGDLVVVDGLTAHTVFRGECGDRFALGEAFP